MKLIIAVVRPFVIAAIRENAHTGKKGDGIIVVVSLETTVLI